MRVLLDDNIPGLETVLADLVDFEVMNGRDIVADSLAGFDALICRSQTMITEAVLEATNLRFVATATSGVDHIDCDALAQRGIPFASAHGSNADSVVDYVIAATALYCLKRRLDIRELTFGVVGCGAVGGALVHRLNRLCSSVLVSDPPLAQVGIEAPPGSAKFLTLDEVTRCDVLTLHAPLIDDGDWPTRGLIGSEQLGEIGDGLLINAARGGLVDEAAWLQTLSAGGEAVIDTWDGEPKVMRPLARRALVATPHIAGHSYDAKILGTRMVTEAFAVAMKLDLDLGPLDQLRARLPPKPVALNSLADVYLTILQSYAIQVDDRGFRPLLHLAEGDFKRAFDDYRRGYPPRRDFAEQQLEPHGSGELGDLLNGLFAGRPG